MSSFLFQNTREYPIWSVSLKSGPIMALSVSDRCQQSSHYLPISSTDSNNVRSTLEATKIAWIVMIKSWKFIEIVAISLLL